MYIHVHSIQSGHYLSPTAYTKVVEKSKTGDPQLTPSQKAWHLVAIYIQAKIHAAL